MRENLLSLASKIRHGNSLNAKHATEIRIGLLELAAWLEHAGDINAILAALYSLTKKQIEIMDQNAAINAALDALNGTVSNKVIPILKSIADEVKPGMTDTQATAVVDRINQLNDQLGAAAPAPTDTQDQPAGDNTNSGDTVQQ